jgi:hypothetical protein
MAQHKEFTVATDVPVCCCDAQSPWRRGTNENTNLLLRRYFPRGTDLAPISQAQLDQVSLHGAGSTNRARKRGRSVGAMIASNENRQNAALV